MMNIANFAWIVGLSALGSIIWFIRLEAKVIYLERDHNKLEDTSNKTDMIFNQKVDKLGNDLNEIKISLMRIETRMFIDTQKEP